MQFKKIIIGNNRKNIDFDIANLSDDVLQEIAGGIISFTLSPIAALADSTMAELLIGTEKTTLRYVCTDGRTGLRVEISIDKFGCSKDNYNGPVSELVQFYMQEHYGQG